MSGVFISYRREDSGGYAGRLFDILSARFGKENTFMDVDAISGGDNFVTVIEQKVGLCDVLLAVIGERWLTVTDEKGTRRLDNPGDFVSLEISKALERGVRVIPILVSKATMPRQADLPEDLRALSLREAVELRDEYFRDDANRLVDLLARTAP
ncbi:MAG TPA: toll/interleukin-1 receptor domain-containing protein, partial [Acidisarcina sp.]